MGCGKDLRAVDAGRPRDFDYGASQDDSPDKAGSAWHNSQELAEGSPAGENYHVGDEGADTVSPIEGQSQEAEEVVDDIDNTAEKPPRLKDRSSYGSAVRRAGRNVKKTKDLPRVTVPNWFITRNVTLHEALLIDKVPGLVIYSKASSLPEPSVSSYAAADVAPPPQVPETTVAEAAEPEKARLGENTGAYGIDEHVYREISAMVSAGLQPSSSQYADSYPALKKHIVLHCPKDGGTFFLDTVVKSVAASHKADLIVIDAQDIAEIGGEHLGEPADMNSNSLRSLGYHVHLLMERQKSQREEENAEEEDEYDEDEDEDDSDDQGRSKPLSFPSSGRTGIIPIIGNISDLIKSGKVIGGSFRNQIFPSSNSQPHFVKAFGASADDSEKVKATLLIEALLNTPQIKRQTTLVSNQPDADGRQEDSKETAPVAGTVAAITSISMEKGGMEVPSVSVKSKNNNLIIAIKDYAEVNGTRTGGTILKLLHEIVQRRRKEGHQILILGTTSAEDLIPSMSRSGFRTIQTETNEGPTRTIITPCRHASSDLLFAEDEKMRRLEINLRHIRDMLLRLAPDVRLVDTFTSDTDLRLDSAQVYASGLNESVWPFERVHRAAAIALGLVEEDEDFSSAHLNQALTLIESSDDARYKWIAEEKEEVKKLMGPLNTKSALLNASDVGKEKEDRMKKLRKTCNSHEKKLLSGVVDAESINTTFADVRAPAETVEALKTLTTLSLIRPDAFTYGVLATDKIPGLLLYGPPGTGKTLLAKAVAKESGATVLEISGSDVYDMYVGEGEKNVKAIFTLAKKLTPCVVFIDEADAIFGSRGTSSNRTSHRELINQFLREWDGMNDLSAFIMVATNRPFDLDDAVLRRLPRRLLVDLPLEKDREAILQIHLKGEILDPSVSLPVLASQTPFYSGSDLKNLAVAAALACVREENDTASASVSSSAEPHTYPEKRILAPRHFDKALEEISASVSEDMSSLSAIRKFDEKFGDRRGRRKRSGGYGFGTMSEVERNNVESVRVRAQN
ncbi:hypothetical protein MMC24_007164 [Lignoscripta atroalba]|nr:hypothetical protein [Lignoscripta atroalba]